MNNTFLIWSISAYSLRDPILTFAYLSLFFSLHQPAKSSELTGS